MERQTFHHSARKVLFISQIFALFPTSNLLHNDVSKLRYKWFSVPAIYTLIIMILNVLEFGAVIYMIYRTGLNFHTSSPLSLFSVCLMEHIFFWRLAIKWPRLMQQWRQVENIFLKAPYNKYVTFNMKFWIQFWYTTVMSCGMIEHLCLIYNSFHKSGLETIQCKLNISHMESLYNRERTQLRPFLPFHYWLMPFLEWLNLTLAYPRSFTDAFVIIISIGLTARFHQLYLRIKHVEGKAMPLIFWTETREHYLVLKKLLGIINLEISALILLSCANNMYFICFQLFNSFNNIGVDGIAEIAFWFSLLYNIFRTILTFYLAGLVDEYTKKMLSCLRDIPSRSWCMETQRFSEQLSVDLTAFTASGFFSLTRKLILAVKFYYNIFVVLGIFFNSCCCCSCFVVIFSFYGMWRRKPVNRSLQVQMASSVVTYELMVINVINQGPIKQITNYCSQYVEEHNEIIKEYT